MASNPVQAETAMAVQIAQAIADALQANQPKHDVLFADRLPRSSFNPTGKRDRKLRCDFFQNDGLMNIEFLHDEEISLLNQLRPGKYDSNGVIVTVVENDLGESTEMRIHYKTKELADRMRFKGEFKNLTEMLRFCVNQNLAAKK